MLVCECECECVCVFVSVCVGSWGDGGGCQAYLSMIYCFHFSLPTKPNCLWVIKSQSLQRHQQERVGFGKSVCVGGYLGKKEKENRRRYEKLMTHK